MENTVFQYTGEDAIKDGKLIDVTERATRYFNCNVRLSSNLYNEVCEAEYDSYDSKEEKIKDIFWTTMLMTRGAKEKTSSVDVEIVLNCSRTPDKYINGEPIHILKANLDISDGYAAINILFQEDL